MQILKIDSLLQVPPFPPCASRSGCSSAQQTEGRAAGQQMALPAMAPRPGIAYTHTHTQSTTYQRQPITNLHTCTGGTPNTVGSSLLGLAPFHHPCLCTKATHTIGVWTRDLHQQGRTTCMNTMFTSSLLIRCSSTSPTRPETMTRPSRQACVFVPNKYHNNH